MIILTPEGVAVDAKKKKSSLLMTFLMLSSLLAVMAVPTPVQASEIVLTDAINVVNSGTNSDNMVAVNADSEGNVHFVWSRNTQHLYYKMLGPAGETLISETQISNPGHIKHGILTLLSTQRIGCTLYGQTGQVSGPFGTRCWIQQCMNRMELLQLTD